MENHGSVSATMVEVGYSPNSAKNPKILTESKGFKEIMEKELPDGYLLRKHRKLIDKTDKEGEIDVMAVSKGLDMAYKLGDRYAPITSRSLNLTVNLDDERKRILREIFPDETDEVTN